MPQRPRPKAARPILANQAELPDRRAPNRGGGTGLYPWQTTFLAGKGPSLQPQGFNLALAQARGLEVRGSVFADPNTYGPVSGVLRRNKRDARGTLLAPVAAGSPSRGRNGGFSLGQRSLLG